jgi:predicted transposase
MMEQMTVTAKIQISVSELDKVLLDNTMFVYRDACNYVSNYVFRTHDLKQFSLNKALYSELRKRFGLKSQMAQSVFKTVIARYKTILENQNEWIKPSFKKPQYDLVWNRDYSLTKTVFL